MQPLVSVVVPVFNGMPHLENLTRSVLNQDYPNLEIIFSEGGGSDASAEFLATLTDPRVRIVRQPAGTSAAENWTAATSEAQGEFIKLVCQDDLLEPDAISQQVQDLAANPTAVMAVAPRNIVDALGKVVFPGRGLNGLPKGAHVVSGAQAMRACYVQGTNVLGEPLAVLFRAQALRMAMPWDDSNPLMLDLTTYAKLAEHGSIAIRRNAVGAFRVSASSWSTRLASQQAAQTKLWQQQYASLHIDNLTPVDHIRAFVGRQLNISMRRAAYTFLRFKGSLNASGAKR